MKRRIFPILASIMLIGLLCSVPVAAQTGLPVLVPDFPVRDGSVRNIITLENIRNFTGGDSVGLQIDLGDENLNGTIYTGQYPFENAEADYDYARYRRVKSLTAGKGTLQIDKLLQDKYNANDWPAPVMTLAYRLEVLHTNDDGSVDPLGFYDQVVSIKQTSEGFEKALTVSEGPFVSMVRSDDPTTMSVAWETDDPCIGMLYLADASAGDILSFVSANYSQSMVTRHEVEVTGLMPDHEYLYFVMCYGGPNGEWTTTPAYKFRTAPVAGQGEVVFAFSSDSREGVGNGERNYMGSNFYILNKIGMDAYRKGASFFIFGGDLVNGYTSEPEDFRLQLKGWKQALAGFWRSAPVYPAMGNHETLLNVFDDGSSYGISLDKWPYDTESAEALFAQEFVNPENGPEPADPRRPTYKENLYTFQYGPVLCIAFNNNYWWTTNGEIPNYGGSPEGYMMDDQLSWIEDVLADAETDSTIKYIVFYAQEPVFPCGGHVKDAMWWNGDNNVKAYSLGDANDVVPDGEGMIDVRNRFWGAIAKSTKVAAVCAGDEHEYHRVLIDNTTPVGVMPTDDTNGDGVLDNYSPNPEFTNPTWQLTAGTGGAPYYSRESTPWEPVKLSSQHGYILFEANSNKISATFYSVTGQAVDHVDNLMAVKN